MTATTENTRAVGEARDGARWVMLIVLLCGQFMALLDSLATESILPE